MSETHSLPDEEQEHAINDKLSGSGEEDSSMEAGEMNLV